MQQTVLNFDSNPFAEGTQNHRLWNYLKTHRAITTNPISGSEKSTAAPSRQRHTPGRTGH